MSVNKYLSLAAAALVSVVTTAAIAGGPDHMATPMPMYYSGFYADFDIGWGGSRWSHFLGGVMNPTGQALVSTLKGSVTKNGDGGFSWGGNLGYQFNQYFSVEVGAYDLESVKGTVGVSIPIQNNNPIPISSGSVKVSSWALYMAGKIAVPLFYHLDMFGKMGMAFRFLNYSGAGIANATAIEAGSNHFINDQHYATWLAGVGLQYWFTSNWSVNAQYLHIPGYNRAQEVAMQSPNVNLILGGMGYKFMT